MKERKTGGETDLHTAPDPILALEDADPVPGLILLAGGRAPEKDPPLVEEAPLDEDLPAQGTGTDGLLLEGGALVLLHHLAAVPLDLGLLEKQ